MSQSKERSNAAVVPDALLSAALDSLTDAVGLVRLSDGVIRWVNRSFETLFGHSAAAAIGRTSLELGLWVDPAVREETLNALRSQGRVRRAGVRARRRSGDEFDCEYSAGVVELHGEAHAVAIIRDVSDRVRSERVLARSEEKFARLFRDGPIATSFVRVGDGVLVDVNVAWERQFGWPRGEALGRTAAELGLWVRREDRANVVALIARGGSVSGYECELKNRAGASYPAALDAARVEIGGEPYFLFVARDLSREKAAQAEAQERGERIAALNHMLRLVIDTIPVRVFWKNTHSRYLGCNALFARDAGRSSPDEIVGRTDYEMGWRAQADLYRTDDAAVMASGKAKLGYEEPQSTPDGKTIWLRTSKVPLRDPDGRTVGVLGTYEDITESVKLHEALRRADERMVQAFQASPEPIAIIGLEDGVVQSLNPKCEQLMGVAASDFVGRTVRDTDMVMQDQSARFVAELRQHGVVRGQDLRVRRRDGTELECEVSGALIESGGEPAVVAIFRDVSEERRSRREREAMIEELARQERRFRLLTTILPAGVFLTDPDGRGGFANDSLCDIIGAPNSALLGEGWTRYIDAGDMKRVGAALRRAGESGEAAHLGVRVDRPDGTPRDVIVGLAPQRDEAQNRLVGFVGVVTDITEQMSAERRVRELNAELEARIAERTRQLQEAMAELESFSYTVAHDLRAPLRSVGGFGQMLAEDCGASLSAQGRDYLQRMVSASNRMAAMIDGLLDMSRLARKELRRRRTDLSALATEILTRLSESEPARKLRWSVQAGLEADCDPTLAGVVLDNLLANAWKYTGRAAQPEISVGARPGEAGETVFVVRDNGVGFDMRYADKLFGVFQRLHAESEFPGTGIGLSTARRAVQRHGGRIWAEARPCEGASFYFTLGPGLSPN
jgi:PAS domain S-box-containing protein